MVTFADRRDDAGAVKPRWPRVTGVHAEHVEHVLKIQALSPDRNLCKHEQEVSTSDGLAVICAVRILYEVLHIAEV